MTGSLLLPGLDAQVVVVTGAAGGQGFAECRVLAENGAHVIATDLAAEPTAELAELGTSGAGSVRYVALDVSSTEGWGALADELAGDTVRGLVNNAGIPFRGRLGELALDDWNRVLSVNLTGAMLGIQAMLPLMTRGSAIVNVGSSAAVTPHYTAAYTASKWALRGLSAVAAVEFGDRGIRSNIVHPGYIETAFMAKAPAAMTTAQLALTPLERLGTPSDVASAVAFLLSDASSYITGAELAIDGGFASGGAVKFMSDSIRAAT
ncbi:SDR family NAD(P)-dependent oxidoreductase [Subtercola sp. YIM 133946]|uniref:SDR family NAD(P)-dependent oxidoreductase n=1 Tax=Subtercola sp. YIM 133946 TaxID=3118909 RepID=UPI002F957FCC